jgi:mRNA-degrading endonuclease RelE of RelBE toxin-antitoxin system
MAYGSVLAMEFIEAPAFTRHLGNYLDDEQLRRLQSVLANSPQLGDVMPGTGGFRKLRWADARRHKGRRGGLRVIYYWFDESDQIWLMAIFDKNEAVDLAPEQRKVLKAMIDAEKRLRSRR